MNLLTYVAWNSVGNRERCLVLQVLVGGRPDGTHQVTLVGTDGKQTITQPDGISQTGSITGDPRFGLQSPIPTSLNVNTPGGKAGTLTNSRTATLSDPTNPLSLTSQTDTVNFNGRTATRTYNATTRTAALAYQFLRPEDGHRQDGDAFMPRIPRHHPVGTPEYCVERLTTTMERTGLQHVMIVLETPADRRRSVENIKRFSTKVLAKL